MIIHIDISGQILQKNKDSSLGFKRTDGKTNCVKIKSRTKKAVLAKYKGQINQLPEKLHCILIYYCIRDYLKNVEKLVICRDENFQRVAHLLPFLFKNHQKFKKIKLKQKPLDYGKSNGHYPALKGFRKNKYVDKFITREMIEKKILEFK